MHATGMARYKNGALNISKDSRHKLERGDYSKNRETEKKGPILESMRPKKKEKRVFKYDEIKKTRDENPEFMMGKRYMKKKGSMAKLNRGGKKAGKGKKGGKKH